VLGHALDITERVVAEQALRESEERFRLIADHAQDLIALMNLEGRCRYLSPSCEAILGYPLAALLGTDLRELIHADDLARVPDWRDTVLYEFRVRHADGRWIWLEGSSARVTWQGEPHLVAIARDISERRWAEDERALRLAQEQVVAREQEARARSEAALSLRDEVLTLATHDLRSPLMAVLGRAQLMRLRAQQEGTLDAAWLDEQLEALNAAGTRMLATIDEMADVARLQLGERLDLQLGEVDLGALASVVAEDYAGTHGARITVMAPAEVVVVRGDQARLLRVLQNLVENALRYSAPDSPVEVCVAQQRQEALVTVRDQGVGIPAADLPHVFTPFFRASTAQGTRGSGLGLAGVKLIVEQHGGRVEIASAVDKGTTVTVRLPRDLTAGRPRQATKHGHAEHG
jgi:PAS domain S-box-containing protein